MALFDKMKDSITIAGQGVSQKAKSATESVRIGNLIKANDRMIDKLTHQVGIQYVNKYINDPNSEFIELLSEIIRLREENRKLQLELQQATAVNTCPHCGFNNNMTAKFCISCGAPLSAAPAAPVGGRICPKCGFPNAADGAFCVECGAQMPPAAPASGFTPAPTPSPASPVSGRICPKCGFSNAEDVAFCVECGTQMPPVAPVSEPAPASEPSSVPPVNSEPIVENFSPEETVETAAKASSPVSLCKESEETAPVIEAVPEETVSTAEAAPPANLCKNCGAVLDDDSLFCTECGTKRD